MNFLEKKAMNKAAEHIQPYLSRGEALMDFEIGRVPAGQVALLATNMALYVCALPLRGEPMIAPYEAIADAALRGNALWLTAQGGTQLIVDLGGGVRSLSEVVIHQVRQAQELRSAEEQRLEQATTARCRGHFSPLLLSEQAEGGPGVFRITDGEPIFETDDGTTHSYGWDMVHDFARSEDGVEVRLHPGLGARIYLVTEDVDRWSAILRDAGVAART